jgi:Holliday junction resolvase
MPNKNYLKGRRKEYKIVNQFKEKGLIAQRTAGSHSPFDVIAINPKERRIFLVQAKPETMSENQKNKIKKENELLNGLFIVQFDVI